MRLRNHAALPHFSRGPRVPRFIKPGLKSTQKSRRTDYLVIFAREADVLKNIRGGARAAALGLLVAHGARPRKAHARAMRGVDPF